MKILDIHSHHQAPHTVTALSAVKLVEQFGSPDNVILDPNFCYSIGIHPWSTADNISDAAIAMLNAIASRREVVAIGECGIDTTKGGPMFRQINTFKFHIQLSESLRKPLIIHNVKAHDIILGLYQDAAPSANWAIHGFRYKPQVAQMFTQKGIYLSFGQQFNAETLRAVPRNLILAETDDAPATDIQEVITAIASSLDTDRADLENIIADNATTFLS